MFRQMSYRRAFLSSLLALIFVASLACEDLTALPSGVPTALPGRAVTAPQSPTPTAAAASARIVPTADSSTIVTQPAPTATPFARRLAGAARFTPTPASGGDQPFVDGPDQSGLTQATSAFSSAQSNAAGRFAISVDGSGPDLLDSTQGGYIWAEVADSNTVGSGGGRKSLSTVHYQPFDIEVGMDMSGNFYDWVRDAIDEDAEPASGEVIAVGADFGELSVRRFLDSFITEITFPALDGSSKEAAHLGVRFVPAVIDYDQGNGDFVDAAAPKGAQQKKWLASNFRIEIGDLPTDRVSKVDSFTWKQNIHANRIGDSSVNVIQPTTTELSNLTLTISMIDIDDWADWFNDFVVQGQSSNLDELSGSITFLAPDLQGELATVLLDHIGIVTLALPSLEAGGSQVPQFTVELYIEDVFFEYIGDGGSGSVVASAPTPIPTSTPAQPPTATPAAVFGESTIEAIATATATTQPPVRTTVLTATAVPATGNGPPKVTIVSALEDVEGSPIQLDFLLSDSTGDPASIEVTFSIDGGRSFRKASPTSRLALTRNLTTSASGVSHSFTWNSGLDLGSKAIDSVLVRVTASDASTGRSTQFGPFAYNPLRNTVANACGIRDGQWLLDERNWVTLHKALLVCQNDLVVSLQDGLVTIDKTARSTRTLSATLNNIASAKKLTTAYGSDAGSLQSVASLANTGSVTSDKLTATLATLDDLAAELDKTLASLGEDSQLANLELQSTIQELQQALQMLTNVSKVMHDTAMSIIRNIRA